MGSSDSFTNLEFRINDFLLWFFYPLLLWQTEGKTFLGQIRFTFSTSQTEKKNLGQNLSDEFINRLSFWVPFFTSIQKMFKTRKWNKKYCVTIWSNWQNYAWHSLKITCKTLAWNIVFCQPFRFWKLLFGRILLQKHVQFFPHARFARNLRSQIH